MSKGETRVEHLQRELKKYKMDKACGALELMIFIMNEKNGFKRKDGSHYYYHLVDATQDLFNLGIRDETTLTACILHDFVEDVRGDAMEVVIKSFGVEVARIVDLVTKKEGIDYKDEEGKNITAYLDSILLDVRACLVKTADRKHNFSTMEATSSEHERRQVYETETYFIPFFKKARKMYPEYSAYFHSAKTTIVPHLKRIKKANQTEDYLRKEIEILKEKVEMMQKVMQNKPIQG
jgi:(p)ppGpp synthase/HD superfamily hydrolase